MCVSRLARARRSNCCVSPRPARGRAVRTNAMPAARKPRRNSSYHATSNRVLYILDRQSPTKQ
eukprot:4225443-Pleurochrysis_carterae.AAC.5